MIKYFLISSYVYLQEWVLRLCIEISWINISKPVHMHPASPRPEQRHNVRNFSRWNHSIDLLLVPSVPTLSFKRTCHPAYNVRISAEKGNRGTKSIGGWEIQAGARDACQKDKQLTHLFHLRSVALTLAQRWHCLRHWAWHWQNWQRVWRVS